VATLFYIYTSTLYLANIISLGSYLVPKEGGGKERRGEGLEGEGELCSHELTLLPFPFPHSSRLGVVFYQMDSSGMTRVRQRLHLLAPLRLHTSSSSSSSFIIVINVINVIIIIIIIVIKVITFS
jgi:hypothetical protein